MLATFDPEVILSSCTALLEPTTTKEQALELGQQLEQANIHLNSLSFNEAFKDSQEALVAFLGLRCCSELKTLEYKSTGSSFAKLMMPTTESTMATNSAIHTQIPFSRTLTSLKLGYNADAPQAENDIALLNKILQAMPLLKTFTLDQPLDDFTLFTFAGGSGNDVGSDSFLPALKRLSVAFNTENCLLDEEEVKSQLLSRLRHKESLQIDIDLTERESSFYLNQSRDRHFQAFVRRFGGERKQ